MTPQNKHLMRCETCKNPNQDDGNTKFKYCPIVEHYVLMMYQGKYITYSQLSEGIVKVGCASHSNRDSYKPDCELCNADPVRCMELVKEHDTAISTAARTEGAKEEQEQLYLWIKANFWIHDEPEYTQEEWIKRILDHLESLRNPPSEPLKGHK